MKYYLITILFIFPSILNAQEIQERIATLVQDHVDHHQFSGTVLVADRGTVIYQDAFGSTRLEDGAAITTPSVFGIASITKMLTAIRILQLVEAGQLKLEDNLATLLPDLDIPKNKKITIHHLLLHISGLPNESDLIYLQKRNPVEFIEMVLSQKGKTASLGKYNYNNVDYVLLGIIIERLTQKSWKKNIEAQFIEPLGLENTGFLTKGNYPKNFAYPYQFDKQGQATQDPEFHIENFYAAGSMYSTTTDLLKIDQAMYGEQLLKESSKTKMFKSYPAYNYTGYSVWTYRYPFVESQPQIMERRGGILGTNVVLIRLLESQQSIIILSNNNAFNPDSFGDENNLREALIRILASNDPEK